MIDKTKIKGLIYELIKAIGENPEREGLRETPDRVAKMYEEILSGTQENLVNNIKVFNEHSQQDGIILVKDIPFYSMCEHHILPFFGVVHVGYIPKKGEIIGLSKIARIVYNYSRCLQVQERLTNQIADFIFNDLNVLGCGVIVEAEHLCMTMRGVQAMGCKTKTLVTKGVLYSDEVRKKELYSLL